MELTCQECGCPIPSDDCPNCHQPAPLWAKYCPSCGKQLIRTLTKSQAKKKRQLCSDESCIGIIGPNGVCTECGKRPLTEKKPAKGKKSGGYVGSSEDKDDESASDTIVDSYDSSESDSYGSSDSDSYGSSDSDSYGSSDSDSDYDPYGDSDGSGDSETGDEDKGDDEDRAKSS